MSEQLWYWNGWWHVAVLLQDGNEELKKIDGGVSLIQEEVHQGFHTILVGIFLGGNSIGGFFLRENKYFIRESFWSRYRTKRKRSGKSGCREWCWLLEMHMSNATYVTHFHFLYVINAIDGECTLINKAVKTWIRGDQQGLCKQNMVTWHTHQTHRHEHIDRRNETTVNNTTSKT